MKKILLLLTLIATSSHAEDVRGVKVVCDKTEVIISQLKEKFKEIPILAGKNLNSVRSTISVWGNPATETFTILDSHGDTSCVLAIGTDIVILLKEGEGI